MQTSAAVLSGKISEQGSGQQCQMRSPRCEIVPARWETPHVQKTHAEVSQKTAIPMQLISKTSRAPNRCEAILAIARNKYLTRPKSAAARFSHGRFKKRTRAKLAPKPRWRSALTRQLSCISTHDRKHARGGTRQKTHAPPTNLTRKKSLHALFRKTGHRNNCFRKARQSRSDFLFSRGRICKHVFFHVPKSKTTRGQN